MFPHLWWSTYYTLALFVGDWKCRKRIKLSCDWKLKWLGWTILMHTYIIEVKLLVKQWRGTSWIIPINSPQGYIIQCLPCKKEQVLKIWFPHLYLVLSDIEMQGPHLLQCYTSSNNSMVSYLILFPFAPTLTVWLRTERIIFSRAYTLAFFVIKFSNSHLISQDLLLYIQDHQLP